MIIQTNETTFTTTARGMTLTLSQISESWGNWVVEVDNAAARAWNRGRASAKYFDTLEQVEAKYKSFRGIAALIEA
jgi:hypothetical protein